MQHGRWLRKIVAVFCGIALASVLAEAQRAQGTAQGTLTVTAVVEMSATLISVDGQWKLLVANTGGPADSLSSLTPVAVPLSPARQPSRIGFSPSEETGKSSRRNHHRAAQTTNNSH